MKRLPVHRILGLGVPLGLLLVGCLVLVVIAAAPRVAASKLGDPLPGGIEAKVDIKGTKLEDHDADGVLGEDGETGLSGWEIRAYDDLDANGILSDTAVAAGPVKTATTDASGAYNLAQLSSGAYIICEVAQTGWVQSYPAYPGAAGSADCSAGAPLSESGWAITLGTTDSTGNAFGNWTPATVSGAKLEDANANADISEDAGNPLANWTINAYADDGDGVLSAAEFAAGEVSTRTTGTNGGYSFTFDPGDYILCEEAKSAWTQSYPGNNICAAGTGLGAGGWALSLTSSDNISNRAFGNWTPSTATGTKFEDLDADGQKDTGEPALGGFTIWIDYDDDGTVDAGEPSALTSTDAGTLGQFTITGINPGSWSVREAVPAGESWTCSYPNAGSEPVPVVSSQCYHPIDFQSGAPESGINFGNWPSTSMSGAKFEDLDADGQPQEAGEPDREDFTIWVDYDDDGMLDAGEPSAVTGSNGSYAISDIRLGNWKVREQAPAGQAWSCSFPNAGTEPVPVESTQCYHQIEFQAGVSPNGIDFGNWAAATVTGVKLEDKDADGIIGEGGDKPIEGWLIHAFADDGDRILSAAEFAAGAVVSDTSSVSTGAYSLMLPPGDYVICEGAQSGWAQSYPSYPSAANSADCSAGATMLNSSGWAVSLQSASSEADRDFGNWTNATVTGLKLEDKDADGSIGEDSANGLDGWVIRAYSDGDGDGVLSAAEFALGPTASSTTTSSGAYSLSLMPGDYIVCEEAQAGWTQSYPDAGNTACSGGVPTLNSGGWALTVQSSGRDPVRDFGNWTNAAVMGTKLEDKDADGDISTGNESPLAGWVIHAYADDDGDGTLSAAEFAAGPIASNTTDILGDYSLTLPPGDYILCEEAQPGWAQSYPSYPGDAGSADCSAGDPALHGGGWAVTLESSGSEPNKHFGNYSECDIHQVTDTAESVTNAQPSLGGYGDGVRIAFVSDGNLDPLVGNVDGSPEIFWVAPETLPITFRQITPVSDGMTNEQPVISGDGEQIAFASDAPMAGNVDRNQEIFRYGIEHGRIVGVTDSTASVFPGFNLSPSIDESGTRIVFASDHNLTGQNPDANLEIYLYDQAYVFDHVSADGYHTCGVRIDGQVECWGRPYEGQSSPPTGSWAEVSAGFYHTCGVRIDGQVECWGDNYEGQSSPPAGPFSQISAGGYHTCGLRPDGLVECWGRNYEGQSSAPGDTFTQVTAGYLHTCGLRPNGSVVCWGFSAYGQSWPPAGTYSQVSAGVWHTCGLRDDGSVACWGDIYGGYLPPTGAFTNVSAGYGHSCGLRPEGSVECWGDPSYGKSSPPSGSFHQISAGIWHSCGVRDEGRVACWGRNDYGQAQAARGGPTLEQVTVSESNTNAQPSLSGNGQYVAFVSDRDGNPEIFVARLEVVPVEVIQVTHTGGGVTHAQPSISHDGQRIAFVSDQDGNPEIYILDWDTTPVEVVQVTNTSSGVMNGQPSLSGTGQYVAFVSDEDGNPEIFVARLDVDPIDTVQITATGEGFSNDQPSMDGLGRRIAFISDGNLDGDNGDGNSELFVSTCGVNLPPVALQVTKDGESAAYAGQGFAYTITVTNTDGANAAFDVGLVDTLEGPGTVSPVGSLCEQGSGSEKVTCHLGQLLPNQSETFLVWARVAANASPNDRLDNSVRLTAVNSGDAWDTFATTVVKGTDISVRKISSASSVRAGEPITYTINVRHEFGGPATVVLTDTLIGDLSVPPGDPMPDCGNWVGSAGVYTLTCNLGQMTLGSAVVLTFAITPRQVGVITNTVAVATTNVEDPLPDNNIDTLVLWPPPIHLPMVLKGH